MGNDFIHTLTIILGPFSKKTHWQKWLRKVKLACKLWHLGIFNHKNLDNGGEKSSVF